MKIGRALCAVGGLVGMLCLRVAVADDLSQGLVGYWNFDEGTNASVSDASGNANTGTLSGAQPANWENSKCGFGAAFRFHGGNPCYERMEIAPSPSLCFDGAISMALWVKPTFLGGLGGVLCHEDTIGIVIADGSYRVYCSGSFSLTNPAPASDLNNWVHLAVVNDGSTLTLYRNGTNVGATVATGVPAAPTKPWHVGIWPWASMMGVCDEVAIWNRGLSASEVALLWNNGAGQGPLGTHPSVTFARRSVFYRDDTNGIPLLITPLTPASGTVQVDCVVGGVFTNHQSFAATSSSHIVTFPFPPSLMKCSNYLCQVTVTTGNVPRVANLSLTVVSALRRDLYTLSPWTSDGSLSDDEMTFYHTLGLNQFMSHVISDEELERLGLEGMLYHSSGYVEGSYAPTNRPGLAAQARQLAESLAPFPNWTGTDVNDEHGGMRFPDETERAAWFDDWAHYEADPPFYPVVTNGYAVLNPYNPNICWFLPGDPQPGPDGVYDPPPVSFQFLDWWHNHAEWQINALVASEIKSVRPDVTVWTEPVAYPGQVLDAGANWSYSRDPAIILGEFESSYANCRVVGKPFYAVLGMEYTGYGNWPVVEGPNPGVTNLLTITPDDMIQQAWIASQVIPSDGLFYYWWQVGFHGLRGESYSGMRPYSAPNSAVALGTALTNDILPAGTMLKGIPNAQRPVALLWPDSTTWFAWEPLNHVWVTWYYSRMVWYPCLATLQLPYDIVTDADITPGSLAQYKAIIFPMGVYASALVSNELAAAGASGTKIIVDAYGAQDYLNMERWPQENYYSMADPSGFSAEVSNTLERMADLAVELEPEVDYAVGELGPLFTNVRESEGVKYMAVINNCRTNGAYTTWTRDPTFQPYGRQQQATVYLKAPAGSAVYEFTQSQKLTTTYQDGHHVVTVTLPPHAGRLLCVYPAALDHLEVTTPSEGAVLGVTTTVSVAVIDARQAAAPGRQLVEVRVFDSQNNLHDESGIYCVRDGQALIPFRPALNDAAGLWRVEIRERTSGLTATNLVPVTAALPAVALRSPANGALFTAPATVALAADASDSGGSIAHVEFYRDSTLIADDTTAPYSATWANVAAGTYTLRAKAYDNDGASRVSGEIGITVNDVPAPTVTAPTNGAAYLLPASIAWAVTVANTIGEMTNVSFYTNGAFCTTGRAVSATVFTNLWNPTVGRYALTAKGWDSYGANGTSFTNTVLAWTNQDVGTVVKTGSATYTNPTYKVVGAGADIEGSTDAFRFVYLPLPGSNCTLIARIATLSNPNAWAKAGVMIRKSLAANAVNALVAVTPTTNNGVTWQYRAADGGSTAHANTTGITAPRWVKLVRSGSSFTAYQSATNTSWTAVGTAQTLANMGTNTYVGLALTSHTTSTLCTSTFDNVSITVP